MAELMEVMKAVGSARGGACFPTLPYEAIRTMASMMARSSSRVQGGYRVSALPDSGRHAPRRLRWPAVSHEGLAIMPACRLHDALGRAGALSDADIDLLATTTWTDLPRPLTVPSWATAGAIATAER